MKAKLLSVMMITMFVFTASMASAQEDKGSMKGTMKEGMMGGGEMSMMQMCPMNHMMMKSMSEASIVATEDGGVIVLKGNTLTKYDKDLKLVKEIELKEDMERMQKRMRQMMEMCPMMKMMHGGMMNDDGEDDESQNGTETSDHESHH